MNYFKKTDLPMSKEMVNFWNENGYLVIEDFNSAEECDKIIERSTYLIDNNNLNNQNSIFDTINQSHNDDRYFLDSGDKIRFFFEEKANLEKNNIDKNKHFIVNKIGHALHDLDYVFHKFSHKEELQDIALKIGFQKPKLLQSMYIFKQPKIGGEVVCHQDSTFLYTEPESTVGFWFALEDANKSNGCLQVASGGHKGPLRKIFKKVDGKMIMLDINNEEFPETDTFVEVKKGSLVLLHGRLPHYSCENTSPNSRHAYTIHVIDQNNKYPDWNWLQRPNLPLKSFMND